VPLSVFWWLWPFVKCFNAETCDVWTEHDEYVAGRYFLRLLQNGMLETVAELRATDQIKVLSQTISVELELPSVPSVPSHRVAREKSGLSMH
jgi:hypothetical protein